VEANVEGHGQEDTVLQAPQLNGTADTTAYLNWSEVQGASQYVLERDGSEVYRGTGWAYSDFPGGKVNATHYYRVRATAPGQLGEVSSAPVIVSVTARLLS
jgi:hypothetical protein